MTRTAQTADDASNPESVIVSGVVCKVNRITCVYLATLLLCYVRSKYAILISKSPHFLLEET